MSVDAAVGRRELHRVRQQVEEDLFEAARIGGDADARLRLELRSSTPLAAAIGIMASTAPLMFSTRSTCWRSIDARPATIRDTSSRSSINRPCRDALLKIASIARWHRLESTAPLRSMAAHPRMALSGVRSSWEIVDRKSSFERLACLGFRSRLLSRFVHPCTVDGLGAVLRDRGEERRVLLVEVDGHREVK